MPKAPCYPARLGEGLWKLHGRRIALMWAAMPSSTALATAVALADCLETYTSHASPENIVRLAEALQKSKVYRRLSSLAPEDLGKLLGALPPDVLRQLKP